MGSWSNNVNELGRKVYKRFHSKEKALEYMHKACPAEDGQFIGTAKKSPNFYYTGAEII
jgi:hypothetical protein